MSLRIRWHPGAEAQLKALGWHPSEVVDTAVLRFAATGRGDVEVVRPGRYLLRVGPYRVWFWIGEGDADDERPVMHIAAVYVLR
jgi:hypothetical protein